MPIVLNGTTGITTPTIAATSASTFTGALALPAGGLNVGSGQLAVDASGRVTMASQPAFSAYMTNAGVTTVAAIPLNLTHLNVGSHYNTSTYRFTAPVTGNYLITAGSAVTIAEYADFVIRRNGTDYANGLFGNNVSGNGYPSDSRSIVMPLVAGDFVDIFYKGSSPANRPIRPDYTVFSGCLIS